MTFKLNLATLLKPNEWNLQQPSWFYSINTSDNTGTVVAASLEPEAAAGKEHLLGLQSRLLKINRHNYLGVKRTKHGIIILCLLKT